MKRISVDIILLFSLVLILTACGEKGIKEDFNGAQWGMTIDEVKSLDVVNGVKISEGKVSGDEDFYFNLAVEDSNVFGYPALVLYALKNDIPKAMLFYYANRTGNDDLYRTIYFDDIILVNGKYFFEDLETEDYKVIFDALIEEYGEPTNQNEDAYFWDSDRVLITFNVDRDLLEYKATYKTVEQFISN